MELGFSADIEFFLGLSPSTSLVATVIAVFMIISATVAEWAWLVVEAVRSITGYVLLTFH